MCIRSAKPKQVTDARRPAVRRVDRCMSVVSDEAKSTPDILATHLSMDSCTKRVHSCRAESLSKFKAITVIHDYHDHSCDELFVKRIDKYSGKHGMHVHSQNGGVGTPFPLKLYETLVAVERDGHADIISWQPHGRCFVVHNPDRFKVEVLPTYFKLTKIASFQRQLNLYGFKRLTAGNDRSGYYHELFLRGRPDLILAINRVKVKGTNIRAKSNPCDEPDFWTCYPWYEEAKNTVRTPGIEKSCMQSSNVLVPVRRQDSVTNLLWPTVPALPDAVYCNHPRPRVDHLSTNSHSATGVLAFENNVHDDDDDDDLTEETCWYSNDALCSEIESLIRAEGDLVSSGSTELHQRIAKDDNDWCETVSTNSRMNKADISANFFDDAEMLDDEEIAYLTRLLF